MTKMEKRCKSLKMSSGESYILDEQGHPKVINQTKEQKQAALERQKKKKTVVMDKNGKFVVDS